MIRSLIRRAVELHAMYAADCGRGYAVGLRPRLLASWPGSKADARRQLVPTGVVLVELVFDFDGAGRAVFSSLLHALLGTFGDYIYLGFGDIAVDFEDVRAAADAQLAAGAELFVD